MRVLTITNTKFAVRSWGHLPLPGWNAVGSDGVVISLERFQKKVLSADKKTATLGTGQNWGTVYDWIEPLGVQVVGGRDPGVGVGGFLLGGGISLFNDKKGLGLDQVVRYEVCFESLSFRRISELKSTDCFAQWQSCTGNSKPELGPLQGFEGWSQQLRFVSRTQHICL